MQNIDEFREGLRDGIPIALAYFAVGFGIGIMARNIGLTALQGTITSATNNASAGQYVGFLMMGADVSYIQMAIAILITNARYLVMSCALSQKLSPETGLLHRLLLGYDVTDEIFGISIGRKGYLNPFYSYGAMIIAIPGWAFGTCAGICAGNVLPANVVIALSVSLYGMFIAVIIPPAKKDRKIGLVVILSFIASFAASRLPYVSTLSSGTRTIILTVLIAALAAYLFPIDQLKKPKE